MKKSALSDQALAEAVAELSRGLVDADLGGNVYKKRVALPGRGKRGSVRTLVATRASDRWIFLYGFEKNERSNISRRELRALQEIAKDLLELDDKQIDIALRTGQLTEIDHGHETTEKPDPRGSA